MKWQSQIYDAIPQIKVAADWQMFKPLTFSLPKDGVSACTCITCQLPERMRHYDQVRKTEIWVTAHKNWTQASLS